MILLDNAETRQQAKKIVADGGCMAFRTDTFYGLGVDPFNRSAVQRLLNLKSREAHKPVLVVISDRKQVKRLIVNDNLNLFESIAERCWPGALTIVGRASAEVPDELTARTGTVGVRLPDDADVQALISACGGALTATSANPNGKLPARSADDVAGCFPNEADLKLVVDGGLARGNKPSTIIDVSDSANTQQVQLIREGAISVEQLEQVLQAMKLKLKKQD